MLRYMRKLESRDLSLTHSMIPLGSCTMKLNATAEMIPVTWPEFGKLHPFAPARAGGGLHASCSTRLEAALAEITGFAAVSLQPNAGSQGEYTGLLVIRALPRVPRRGAPQRLPDSALGARHQSGQRRDGGHEGRGREDRRRTATSTSPTSRRRPRARDESRRADGDVSVHARRVRGGDHRHLPHRARARRPGVPGRRQHERDGRAVPAGRHRRRRLPPEPAQDVLHPARRRRAGHGADRRGEAPRAVPARPPGGRRPAAARGRRRLVGAVGQREHPARSR